MVWSDLLIGFLVLLTSAQPSRLRDGRFVCYRMQTVHSYSCTSLHCASFELLHRSHCTRGPLRLAVASQHRHRIPCLHGSRSPAHIVFVRTLACVGYRAFVLNTSPHMLCTLVHRLWTLVLDRMLLHPYRLHSFSALLCSIVCSALLCSIVCSCIHIVLPLTQCVLSRCTSCIGLREFGK